MRATRRELIAGIAALPAVGLPLDPARAYALHIYEQTRQLAALPHAGESDEWIGWMMEGATGLRELTGLQPYPAFDNMNGVYGFATLIRAAVPDDSQVKRITASIMWSMLDLIELVQGPRPDLAPHRAGLLAENLIPVPAQPSAVR